VSILTTFRRIGVLTSGGDCAGLNAALHAVARHAIVKYEWQVYGIHYGTTGLIKRPVEFEEITLSKCDAALLRSGGTFLGSTNKDDPFAFPNGDGTRSDRSEDLIKGYQELGLDALIAIGGDGSMRILSKLAKKGINLVTIPKTIDNDLAHTELSIGHTTALDIATDALDRLHTTAASHQRVMVLEVMGRDAGHIAISCGIAGGAHIILIPEIPYRLQQVCDRIRELKDAGQKAVIVVVAESVRKENGDLATIKDETTGRPRYGGIGAYLGEKIQKYTGFETRVTVLGHTQRGGPPNAYDRLLASAFGVKAVDLVAEKQFNRMVCWQNGRVNHVPIEEAIRHYQSVETNGTLVQTARSLGIYVGDVA
jgi:ATP-dependent phosphofructokinase / diphosphate-dependent phosphofructokinase